MIDRGFPGGDQLDACCAVFAVILSVFTCKHDVICAGQQVQECHIFKNACTVFRIPVYIVQAVLVLLPFLLGLQHFDGRPG